MSQPNVTMVAFHGSTKPPSIEKLLQDVFKEIEKLPLSKLFQPFDLYQIHATIIGMEALVVGSQFYNLWFWKNNRRTKRRIDIHRLLKIVGRIAKRTPLFTIRFGGFRKAYCTCLGQSLESWHCTTSNAEFHRYGHSPYEGSFYIDQSDAVMITGWPVQSPKAPTAFPHVLYDFRFAAESAGFLDKYHFDQKPHWKDDDCYIKLGKLEKGFSQKEINVFEDRIRQYLHDRGPMTVDIKVEDVSFVLYRGPDLKRGDIIDSVSLTDALNGPIRVVELYQELL